MQASTASLLAGLLRGERSCLARAITLIESSLQAHRVEAGALLGAISRHRVGVAPAASGPRLRIGIAGPPGAGKSTLIEALGLHVLSLGVGARIAVLAVDPSSSRAGGSLLGDATRMPELSKSHAAYVRPSPSRGALGGLAPATADAIVLCETAGHGVILVETVGLGQSEVAVVDAVDVTLLVLAPAAGDELQGAKKGIVEVADVLVVNKADGSLENAAKSAAADYQRALSLSRAARPGWAPRVLTASAATGAGIPQVWESLVAFADSQGPARIAATRRQQATSAAWRAAAEMLSSELKCDPEALAAADALGGALEEGSCAPRIAADAILKAFMRRSK
jgi:LAO/AO transport system kinase